MIDFLQFPEKYRVEKEMSVQHFLKAANLTENRREMLSKIIREIRIMYDLPSENGCELIIIGAQITNVKTDEDVRQVARAIAAAIPQFVIVLLYFGKYCRMFFFKTEPVKSDLNRRKITDQISSFLFNAEDPELYMKKMIKHMRKETIPLINPRFTIADWIQTLEYYREMWNNSYARPFIFPEESVEVKLQKLQAEDYEIIPDLSEADYMPDDDIEEDLWSDEPFELDDEIYDPMEVSDSAVEGDDEYHRGYYQDDWTIMS